MCVSNIQVPIKVISYIVLPCNHEHRLSFWLPLCLLVSMLTCADLLQKTKCLTKCLKNLSQLRWLALRPLIQLNRQTASLALKRETKHSGPLCVVLAVISILTSRLHSLVGTWSAFFPPSVRHITFVLVQKYFTFHHDHLPCDVAKQGRIEKRGRIVPEMI